MKYNLFNIQKHPSPETEGGFSKKTFRMLNLAAIIPLVGIILGIKAILSESAVRKKQGQSLLFVGTLITALTVWLLKNLWQIYF